MANGIEISDDLVAALAAQLKDPKSLECLHETARHDNTLLHIKHLAIVAGLSDLRAVSQELVDAVDLGAELYEAFAAMNAGSVADSDAIRILAKRRERIFSPSSLSEITEAHLQFVEQQGYFAGALEKIAKERLGDSALATRFSVGSAAVLYTTHVKINQLLIPEHQS